MALLQSNRQLRHAFKELRVRRGDRPLVGVSLMTRRVSLVLLVDAIQVSREQLVGKDVVVLLN